MPFSKVSLLMPLLQYQVACEILKTGSNIIIFKLNFLKNIQSPPVILSLNCILKNCSRRAKGGLKLRNEICGYKHLRARQSRFRFKGKDILGLLSEQTRTRDDTSKGRLRTGPRKSRCWPK